VLERRYPFADVVVYPTMVQGKAAAGVIAKAIDTANRRAETDVLLVIRGGGSLEDLWAFNEVAVATAIFQSTLPIVSGVGHEVDVTIADLVADVRAPTPSAAAELATPDSAQLVNRHSLVSAALKRQVERQLTHLKSQLHTLSERLQVHHPERLLEQRGQRLDELGHRLAQSMRQQLQRQWLRQSTAERRLRAQTPNIRLAFQRQQLLTLRQRLLATVQYQLQRQQQRFTGTTRALHAVSPLATLDRGFAVLRKADKVITNASQLTAGDRVTALVAHGRIDAEVKEIHPKTDSQTS